MEKGKIKIQVTYFCESGKYKPVATVIEVPSTYSFHKNKAYWIARAKKNIQAKRYWSDMDMLNFGYTEVKCRLMPS
jgi:hypothetical protein